MRKVFSYTWIILVLGGIYLGWTFHGRKSANQKFIGQLEERRSAQEQKIIDAYGGDQLTILAFYGVPPVVRKGEKAQLCYGVSNARDVQIVPPVDYVWPSLGRCVDVAPARTTEYTLITVDAKGNKKTANLKIQVK